MLEKNGRYDSKNFISYFEIIDVMHQINLFVLMINQMMIAQLMKRVKQ